jgi:flagellar hook assembly protein FlgD
VVGPQDYVSQQLQEYMPKEFSLEQNYPNPFNPSTTVTFKMPKEGSVRLEVYSILGQKIKVLGEGFYEAGVHQVVWMGDTDWGARVASGVYFCRFVLDRKSVQTRKMLLTK